METDTLQQPKTDTLQQPKTDSLKHLLQQVSIIQKKYDDLAEYSGEHFNVFEILGVTSNELSHSAILTNLLNAKGRHGQKDLFLKIFIEEIVELFQDQSKIRILKNFKTNNSHAEKEKYAGRVSYEEEEGGRIDIIINDGKDNIIIENKIYAYDQPGQLVRYKKYGKDAPILYLTLDGKEPSKRACEGMEINQDFICISYAIHLANWLEKCIKEVVNKPLIRETLNQYLFLIKSLTNQSNNNKMNQEIIKTILSSKENIKSAFEINKIDLRQIICNELFNRIISKVGNDLIAENYDEGVSFGMYESGMWFSKNKDFKIGVLLWFDVNHKLMLGVDVKSDNNEEKQRIRSINGSSINWIRKIDFDQYFNTLKWEEVLTEENINEIVNEIRRLIKEIDTFKN